MVLSCVMLLPIIDKWNMSWFAHFVIHLPVNLLQFSAADSFVMTCRHSSAITCFAVQFSFLRRPCRSSVYAGYADLSVKELYEHCIDMFMYECRVL